MLPPATRIPAFLPARAWFGASETAQNKGQPGTKEAQRTSAPTKTNEQKIYTLGTVFT